MVVGNLESEVTDIWCNWNGAFTLGDAPYFLTCYFLYPCQQASDLLVAYFALNSFLVHPPFGNFFFQSCYLINLNITWMSYSNWTVISTSTFSWLFQHLYIFSSLPWLIHTFVPFHPRTVSEPLAKFRAHSVVLPASMHS